MKQEELKLRYGGWGGKREGAGRRPGPNPRVPHLRRQPFGRQHPCHVTLKMTEDVPSLRTARLVRELERTLARGCERVDFRLVHYSLQHDHAHLIVEAKDIDALGRGMNAIGARLARAVNRVFGRRGRVLAERYHSRALRTPKEVRAAVRCVLLNERRHARRRLRGRARIDPASSGRWFDGWRGNVERDPSRPSVAGPHTWLLRVGWRRYGLIDPEEVPGPG